MLSGLRARTTTTPRDGEADPVATDLLRLRVAAGARPDAAGLSERCRRAVTVATSVGAPLLDAVDRASAAEDDERRAARAVRVATAQTRVVAAGLVGAPVLLVPGLGRLVGADLIGFYSSHLGLVVLALGLSLVLVGVAIVVWLVRRVGRPVPARASSVPGVVAAVAAGWLAWRLVGPALTPLAALLAHHVVAARAARRPPDPMGLDEAADLAATALAGSVSTPHALRLAAEQLPALAEPLHRLAFELELGLGDDAGREPAHGTGMERLRAVLRTATQVGAPAVPTLRRLAQDLRADDLARVLAAAERLPAQLTFPTALCLLPATVLLIGAPIVHAGLVAAGT